MDLASFVLGALAGGFLGAAGTALFGRLAGWWSPPPIPPRPVPQSYAQRPELEGSFWYRDREVPKVEEEGWAYVLHHETGGRCYSDDVYAKSRAWLMRRPK